MQFTVSFNVYEFVYELLLELCMTQLILVARFNKIAGAVLIV